MHHPVYHTTTPGTMRKAAQAKPAKAAAAAPQQRARRAWRAGSILVVACALAAASARACTAATPGRRRHGRDSEPGARAPRGNQTTAAAAPAPPQERPPAVPVGTLQARADAWRANQTLALAAHGPVAAWDTSAETDLARVFEGAAEFNEDLNAYVLFWRARLCLL